MSTLESEFTTPRIRIESAPLIRFSFKEQIIILFMVKVFLLACFIGATVNAEHASKKFCQIEQETGVCRHG
jgi:hypothetical protein